MTRDLGTYIRVVAPLWLLNHRRCGFCDAPRSLPLNSVVDVGTSIWLRTIYLSDNPDPVTTRTDRPTVGRAKPRRWPSVGRATSTSATALEAPAEGAVICGRLTGLTYSGARPFAAHTRSCAAAVLASSVPVRLSSAAFSKLSRYHSRPNA
jgi:hypothetical protein